MSQHVRRDPPRPRGERTRVARLRQPARGEPREIHAAQPPQRDAGIEKVLLDEMAERGAETLLVFRHDGGVGDRQTQRTAENRRHREPVRAGPDHARLREGVQIGRERP
jgi:hypothetical protein